MNVFRLAGDMTHLASCLVLLLKIVTTKSCRGVSLKTQELYLLVFLTRYLDLFTSFISLYNSVMKVVFIGTTSAIVWYMRRHKVVRQTYDRDQDTFRHELVAAPAFLLALLTTHDYSPLELLWTFSILLEAAAIMPQLVLLQRTGNVDNLTGSYVALLGSYRALYIANWVYRFFTEPKYKQVLVWCAGGVQTALYLDFFYYYVQSWQNNTKLCLPA